MPLKQKGRQLLINTPLGEDFLLLKEFSALETISELFSFQLKLVHEETAENLIPTVVDPKKLLGQPVGIKICMPDKTARYFNGVISHWRQGNRNARFTHYQAIVVPKIWILTQKFQSRIFQRLTVPQILRKVFAGFSVKFELVGTFNRREYCVQYQETDFDFASRLMEEEGIYYYFEHTNSDHKMILANSPLSHRACPTESKFPFETDMTRRDGAISFIATWEMAYQLQTGKITVWDHNFELPRKRLEAEQPSLYPVANNGELEFFQYPGVYAKRYTGVDHSGGDQAGELQHIYEDNQQQAELQMQAIDAKYKVAAGGSNCCPLTVGHKFEIFNHPAKGTDGEYMLTQVTHHAVQSPSMETGETIDNPYQNSFNCIPLRTGSTPFRPVRKTPKSRINGSQTAVAIYEFRETIERYIGLTIANQPKMSGTDEPEAEIFRLSQASNLKLGSICLTRRNRKRLSFHHTEARKDFLYLIEQLSKFNLDDSKKFTLQHLAIELIEILNDAEAQIEIEKMFAGSMQTGNRASVRKSEKDLWKPEIRKPLAAKQTSLSLQTLNAAMNLREKD